MSRRVSLNLATCVAGLPMMVESRLGSGPSSEDSRYSKTVVPGSHGSPMEGGANAANPQTINVAQNMNLI